MGLPDFLFLFYFQTNTFRALGTNGTRLSDLHSIEGCHWLEVSFTEIYTWAFLCSISLVVFYQRFIFDEYSLLWNEKKTLTWFFRYKKKN